MHTMWLNYTIISIHRVLAKMFYILPVKNKRSFILYMGGYFLSVLSDSSEHICKKDGMS